jgi:hypothetical protein
MTDVAAQILARIAAMEDVARAASAWGASWEAVPDGYGTGAVEATDGPGIVVYDEGRPTEEQAAHIAANDPDQVLRLCAALRAVVTEVESWTHAVCDDPWYTCPAATEEREGSECIRERGGPCDCGRDARADRTLSALAGVWGVSGVDA